MVTELTIGIPAIDREMKSSHFKAMIPYHRPDNWIKYDGARLMDVLSDAKAAVLSLGTVPYQRRWVEALQKIELKREVAGTSRIEGAEFTDRELDEALSENPDELLTRSQRQAHAAVLAYRWISNLPKNYPIDQNLICHIHRLIVTDADDDHCPPGELRRGDQNVTFGVPRHRGVSGGEECTGTFHAFVRALQTDFQAHDPIVQAIAAHYHFAAMHPFLDGNGRTARALEALLLQRAGLRDSTFISMSNYYYDEKTAYLTALADTRRNGHDLTEFLLFALKGVSVQCRRLLGAIQLEISKELYRSFMVSLFGRLQTNRKRVIADRHVAVLSHMLENPRVSWIQLIDDVKKLYETLKSPLKALVRDVNYLQELGAIRVTKDANNIYWINTLLDWPARMTETDLFAKMLKMPKAKTGSFDLWPTPASQAGTSANSVNSPGDLG